MGRIKHAIRKQVQPPSSDHDAILSPLQTCALTSLSYSTLFRLRMRGEFPEPIQLSPGRLGWRRRDVADWIATKQKAPSRLWPSPNPRAAAGENE